jgi:hypothetical protein
MTTPIRHHYLPQFYLAGFTEAGGFWVFDRTKKEIRWQTPINTALQSHYYAVQDKDGHWNSQIETELLSRVDSDAKPVIAKLDAGELIDTREKEALSIFIGYLLNRVPDFEKGINTIESYMCKRVMNMVYSSVERTRAVMERMEKKTGEKLDITPEELIEFHKSDQYEIIIHRNASLKAMLDSSVDLANYFRQMNWAIWHCQGETSFVTSDNPFVLVPPPNHHNSFYGVGILTPGAIKIVPLTKRSCLFMTDHGTSLMHLEASRDTTRGINLTIADNCDRFLIGRDEALVRNLVKKVRLEHWERQGRYKIN